MYGGMRVRQKGVKGHPKLQITRVLVYKAKLV